MSSPNSKRHFSKLTLADAFTLAEPPSWVASILPVLLGGALSLSLGHSQLSGAPLSRSLLIFFLMLVTSILAQSSVNVLNDYADFVKGTDSAENSINLTDVPIIHRNLNPKSARNVALVYLTCALIAGLSVVALTGWILLIIGLVGAATGVGYSFGPKPISYLPLGEFISGFVMGELITFATYYALTSNLNWNVLFWTLPVFFGIANIMQTNNTCDIDRDTEAGRKTLPILLGKKNSAHMMAITNMAALAIALVFTLNHAFPWGLILMLIVTVIQSRAIAKIYNFDYNYKTRPQAMKLAMMQVVFINAFYIFALLIGVLS